MCVFSQPSAPPPVVVPPAPAAPEAPSSAPQAQDQNVQSARTRDMQRRLRAQAGNDTLVTGGEGLIQPASTSTNQLYGA